MKPSAALEHTNSTSWLIIHSSYSQVSIFNPICIFSSSSMNIAAAGGGVIVRRGEARCRLRSKSKKRIDFLTQCTDASFKYPLFLGHWDWYFLYLLNHNGNIMIWRTINIFLFQIQFTIPALFHTSLKVEQGKPEHW